MKNIQNLKINRNSTIKEALQVIDNGGMQITLIVDEKEKLIGTLTDGDVRRGLLNGLDLNSPIETIIFKTPSVAKITDSKEEILKIALSKKLHQIPIVYENGKVVGIQQIEELIKPIEKTNKVVLMVGGKGKRLGQLTDKIPKPMLKVGDKPVLHTIINNFVGYGYRNIVMCVNYKSNVIKDYFGDGSDFGVNIDYILEENQMGTAGALSLLKEKPKDPFFVMNGDLLTNVNFENIHDFYISNNANALMCVGGYDFQVPYGVVNIENSKILSIEEKPLHKFFVNAGIYMLSPEVLEYVPKKQFYDMTTFFERLISENKNVISFPLREYWLDIGHIEEYKKAKDEYHEVFKCTNTKPF